MSDPKEAATITDEKGAGPGRYTHTLGPSPEMEDGERRECACDATTCKGQMGLAGPVTSVVKA